MEAQISAACQFCETSTEIKWKCINCNLFLCLICNSKIHSKIKSATEHKVVPLYECGTDTTLEEIRKLDLMEMTCQQHVDRKCFMYCHTCSHVICTTCIKGDHKSHHLRELDEVYQESINAVRSLKDEIQNELSFFEKEEMRLLKIKSLGKQNLSETRALILKRNNAILENVTTKIANLEKEADIKYQESQKDLTEKFVQKHNDLEDRKEKVSKALRSKRASDIFSTSSIMEKQMLNKGTYRTQLKPLHFNPGQVIAADFGVVHKTKNFEVVHFFKQELQIVSKISCYDSELFLYGECERLIQKVKIENDNISLQNVATGFYCSDVKVTCHGQVLILCSDKLYSLEESGDLTLLLEIPNLFSDAFVEGYIPNPLSDVYVEGYCININNKNNISIGYNVRIEDYIEYEDAICQGETTYFCFILSYRGDLKCISSNFNNKEDIQIRRINYIPNQIFTTKSDELCLVLDESVVSLDDNLQSQWTYTGCSCREQFRPVNIAETNCGLILISDSDGLIHLLNENREMLTCNLLYKKDICPVQSITVDARGMLWIGCQAREGDTGAEIFCLKFA